MKRLYISILVLMLFIFGLSGCSAIGTKSANLSTIYGAAAIIAFLLLIGYCVLECKRNAWFLLLFSSVLVVNIGYFWLSISLNLQQALMANRVAYLGSVLLPLSMFLIILDETNIKYTKRLPILLFGISVLVLFIAASPGWLDIYYKEVSFEVVNGVSTLVKVYGPWHHLYLFFLLGYFTCMVVAIAHAAVKKTIDTTTHAVILAIAVFANMGVWLIEQLAQIEFEILSISYIISELFLVGVHHVVNENARLKELVKDAQKVQVVTSGDESDTKGEPTQPDNANDSDCQRLEMFIAGLDKLTHTERLIYEAYIARVTTKEIMASLNIKENTLKFHNKNLYGKLGVSSRKELMEIYKQINTIKKTAEEAVEATFEQA